MKFHPNPNRDSMNYDVVIVRYTGEIGIKSRSTRKWMENILTNNISKKIEKEELKIKELTRENGRIYIFGDAPKTISKIVSNVFGVASTSPAIIVESNADEICKLSRQVAEEILDEGDSFRITTRRIGTHPFTSEDISIKAGAAILDQMSKKGVSVNLSNPDKTIFIEIRHENAYIFHEVIKGLGGMPSGTQGKIAIINSCNEFEGIAAFLMMKRGCEPVPIIFSTRPSLNDSSILEYPPLSILKRFYLNKVSVFLVPFKSILEELKRSIPKEFLLVFCKKMQFCISERLCTKFGMKGIVTGDLLKMPEEFKFYCFVDSNIRIPIYRPLISLDTRQLIKFKNLLGISTPIPNNDFCKDDVSIMILKQFSENICYEDLVNQAIERVIQKVI
jgi:thiamine biosynthesis protein ThiI